jgi:ribosomal protein S18 acetylase RimI-like enzyme
MTNNSNRSTGEGAPPMVSVRRMDAYDRDIRDEVTEVILDGYFSQLSSFTKDRSKFAIAFRDDVRADMFYAAELGGQVVGVLACSDNTGRALVANRTSLRRGLGYVRGTIATRVLGRQFNSALPYDNDTGYIEWVATSEDARGKGIATALFQHVMQHLPYQRLVLEVVDTNDNARRLYANLGFDEYERQPAKGMEKRTFNERIHMHWSKRAARGRPGTSAGNAV